MSTTVRYFGLGDADQLTGLAREIRSDSTLRYEAFGKNGQWNRANSVFGTMWDGDATPISREEAMAMLKRRGREPDNLDQAG